MSDNRVKTKSWMRAAYLQIVSWIGDDSSTINLRIRASVSEKINFDHAVHFQHFVTFRLIIITHSPVMLAMLFHSCVVNLYAMNFCLFLLDRSQIFLVTSPFFLKILQNGQIHGRIALGSLLMLSCVCYLAAERFLRDASLCNKEFCIN
jgi:hypothetical protein